MQPGALMEMINGYRLSQAIHVAATLGIADLLAEGPRSVDELAKETGAAGATLTRLLRALASVGIFKEEVDKRIAQTTLSEKLRSDTSGSLRAWAMQIGQPYFWNSWGHLLGSVKSGRAAFPEIYGMTAWEYRAANPEADTIFNAAMSALSGNVVDALVSAYDFSPIQVLTDVGGGDGTLLAAILKANPALKGILFDQAHVVASAKPRLEKSGVDERCQIVSGSFFETIPTADGYLLKNIIHDWDDAASTSILRRCRDAIADGGRLLIVEQVLAGPNQPDSSKFSDLNMLVMLGGKERTGPEFEALCAAAGFHLTRIIPTESHLSIVECVAS